VTLRAARRVADAEARAAAMLTVVSQHRFDPASRLVHEAIREGRLGRLTSAVASALTACLAHQRIEVEDIAVAVIRFASGALGVLHDTTAAYPGLTARIQVHGDRGSAVIDGDRLTYFHAADDDAGSPGDGAASGLNQAADLLPGKVPARSAGSDPGALSDAHLHQYRDFVEAIEQGRRPAVTVDDAIRALAVVSAVYESARAGEPVPVEVRPRPA
jgi:predicted dehydrogenase